MAECDLGRDYEHCLELQKKVNDTEAVSVDTQFTFHYQLVVNHGTTF